MANLLFGLIAITAGVAVYMASVSFLGPIVAVIAACSIANIIGYVEGAEEQRLK